jgi:hypothetical protein
MFRYWERSAATAAADITPYTNGSSDAIETHFITWVYTTTSSVERVAKRKEQAT